MPNPQLPPLEVTWIAPTVPTLDVLQWLKELGRIMKIPNVHVTARMDSVLLDDVAAVLQQPANIVIWSGHGVEGGLKLSDDSLVRAKWLAAQISRGARPSVAILAACGSQGRNEDLHSLTETICRAGINVVGFPAEAGDSAAATFCVEFVRAMSVSTSVVQAFDVALEAIEKEETAQGVFLTPGIADVPYDMKKSIALLFDRLTQIEITLRTRSASHPVEALSNGDEKAALTTATGGIQSLTTRGGADVSKPKEKNVATRSGHIEGLRLPAAVRQDT